MRWTITGGVAGILFCCAAGGGAQPVLAVGSEAEVTGEGALVGAGVLGPGSG